MRGAVPPMPIHHLVGTRLTQVGSGTAVATMPASPWMQTFDGTVEFRILAEACMTFAVLTGVPAGTDVRPAAMTINNLRPCTVESEVLVARGRVLNSGPTFTFAEVLVEDALGRGVAHGVGTYLYRRYDATERRSTVASKRGWARSDLSSEPNSRHPSKTPK